MEKMNETQQRDCSNAKSWTPLIKTACLWVFWTLVIIDLV